jgi:hypothetical protein
LRTSSNPWLDIAGIKRAATAALFIFGYSGLFLVIQENADLSPFALSLSKGK